jgi:hypothetical protein
MSFAQRRPTPEQAEHVLQALMATNHQLRAYHERRAAGLCAAGCGASSEMAYCDGSRPIRILKQKVWREGRAT